MGYIVKANQDARVADCREASEKSVVDENQENTSVDIPEALDVLDRADPTGLAGRVTEVVGLVVRATVPGARIGELVTLQVGGGAQAGLARVQAEVVGFRGEEVALMPLGSLAGIGPDALAYPSGRRLTIAVGDGLLGRVLDGLGHAIDGAGPIAGKTEAWSVERGAPDPLLRRRITRPLALGIRAIDGLLTVGEGQRVGLFAGSGVGKSLLLGQIARQAEADVNVICLVGERGREVKEFLDDALGPEGRARSVVVCATSDSPCLVRLKSAFVATAIAEWFRAKGKRVLLLMDSLTRFARAQREVGLAAGELPVRQGYPPSVFAMLPQLLERTGNSERGSITAIYTVLVAGGDMEEPISDEARAVLDGHIVLSRSLAERNHWPAIDILPSLSRVMSFVADPDHVKTAGRVREMVATYEQKRDLLSIGAYKAGSDARLDRAVAKIDAIHAFLRQGLREHSDMAETRRRLSALL
jgi:type III secretion protein N (ATPase)